jgi:hypothetical protein
VVFECAKIKELVPDYAATMPFSQGVKECIAWLDAHPDQAHADPEKEEMMDLIIAAYERAWA